MRVHLATERMVALDVFRGAAVAGMILVNTTEPGREIYSQLQHSAWNGCTFADWIFPFFLFAVGMSISFSLGRQRAREQRRWKLFVQIFRRATTIYAVGIAMHGFPTYDWERIIEPLVLKRIAEAYFGAATISLFFPTRGKIFGIVTLLASYWIAMMYIPVPGVGAGVLEPGQNYAVYFDGLVFPGNKWLDPNGLSVLTGIVSALFGVLAGDYFRKENQVIDRMVHLFVWGNILLLLGLVLDAWMPINKRLWSVSYTVYMAGWAQVSIGMLLWMIDKKEWTRWTKPFCVFGMNALVLYVAAGVIGRSLHLLKVHDASGILMTLTDFIYQTLYHPFFEEKLATFLYNSSILALLYVFGWILWKRKIFVRA